MNITLILVIATSITSILAFKNHQIIESFIFYPYRIWKNNEWYRLVSCSFVHADWGHLFFNMFALFSFGNYMEYRFENIFQGKGHALFLIMYFGAVAVADGFNLFTQKNNPSYRSLGASGGVSAVVFAYILLNPFGGISLFFLPSVPAIVFGPLYLVYCAYMAKRGTDNVGHIAHFTGSIFGFIFPIIFEPYLLTDFITQLKNNL
mgnify:CR=1 FL=1